MDPINRQVLLESRPQGAVSEDNFRIVDVPVATPRHGEVLVRNDWLSIDPYMRGRMNDVKSYAPPAQLGAVMVGQTVGTVTQSHDPRFAVGDLVLTSLGWQCYGVARGTELTKIDATRVPASYYLGVLGMPGMTAWIGLFDIGQPKPGDTLVVSAASGAVGSVVGQLGKLCGCHVVGIAGGPVKCQHVVTELGFDACVDHRAGRVYEELEAACPDGVDVYFENVGGELLDTLLRLMNVQSRIVLCGLIAEYDAKEAYGYKRMRSVLVNRIRMQGLIVFDWKHRFGEVQARLVGHLAKRRIKYRESVVDGLDNAPKALIGLLRGENFGKQLVRLG
jgi:hypothetical protein